MYIIVDGGKEIMQEEWRKIDPPFSRYSVSNLGRVRNDGTNYILKPWHDDSGYLRLSLNDESNKSYNKRVHVLVAQQFLGYTTEMQKDRKIVCHHKDENKHNAFLDNLIIISSKENISNLNKIYKNNYYSKELLDNEIWKELYINNKNIKVSNYGRVEFNNKYTFGHKSTSGYMSIGINKKSYRVHKLICKTFHPIKNEENYIVNHIDRNRSNNHENNLEWTTYKDNTIKKPVVAVNNEKTLYFESVSEAAREVKGIESHIILVCNNKRYSTMGYKWFYIEDYKK